MSESAFDLGSYGADLVLDSSQFETSMSNAESQLTNHEGKTKGWAKNIGMIATGAVAGLGVALAGAAVAGVKMADDLNKALNGLQASTGSTDEEMKGMGDSLKNIYNNNFGESFDDIAQSMALVKQNTGLAGKELESATQNALMLRDTFDMDVAGSTNAANSMMKQFGISSKEAFNLIAQGAQNGANKNGDLIDSLNEYSPQFKAMGFSAEQFTNVLIDGAKNGQFSIDKVGDAMKEFNIRSKDLSTTSLDAFKSLGMNGEKMSASFAKGGESAQKSFNQVMTSLNGIKDPVEKNRIGVELFGTQFEDLEAKGIAALGNIGNTASLSKDALGEINKVKYSSFGDAIEGIKRNLLTGLLEPMQKNVLPILSDFANWISAHMPQIEATISTVFSAIGTVIGGFISVVKGIISVFQETDSSTNSSFSKVRDTISTILGTIKGIIFDITSAIKILWQKYGEDIMKYAKTAWENISTVISGVLQVIRGIVQVVTGLLTGDWDKAWKGIKNIVLGVLTAIKGLLDQYLNMYKAVVNTVMTVISNIFKTIWEGIKSTVTKVASDIYSGVKGKFETLSSSISSIFSSIWSTAKTIFGKIKDAITSPIETAKSTVLGLIDKIKGAFNFTWSLPKLKLPHVSVDMKKNSLGIPYPDFDISWYKTGSYFNKPSIVGLGESGGEVILPVENENYMAPFADAVYDRLATNLLKRASNNNVSASTQTINLNPNFKFEVTDNSGSFDARKITKMVTDEMMNMMKPYGFIR
ncbi:phage tail tape measure protein [Neobacillus sp. PS3-40]|uniref:phage tail tape measure protein n=1 Tax=Neobacillus sp. PS3-40 TaxID=3070679 RepID=UPI0027DF5134|nr:phage tail tape measure protein [Neobacillus sp. PS3-40]WML44092.1 phage tail tape measure protein [Neobacillus sp. PS3-40]